MKCFAKTVEYSQLFSTVFAKSSILDVSLGYEYASDYPEVFFLLLLNRAVGGRWGQGGPDPHHPHPFNFLTNDVFYYSR